MNKTSSASTHSTHLPASQAKTLTLKGADGQEFHAVVTPGHNVVITVGGENGKDTIILTGGNLPTEPGEVTAAYSIWGAVAEFIKDKMKDAVQKGGGAPCTPTTTTTYTTHTDGTVTVTSTATCAPQ